MSSIGNVLKLIRTHRNISQKEMANFLGVTQNFLSQVEHGKKSISIKKINEFSQKLGIPKDILIIAGCEIPGELNNDEKKNFLDMKKTAMQIILL